MSMEQPIIEYAGGKEKVPVERYEAAIKKMIEETESGEQIGFGKTGNVLVPDGFSEVCAKVVRNEVSRNNTTTEMGFLERLTEEGFSVPKPIFSVETDENDYLGMERIKGVSLKDILDDSTGEILRTVPDTFDFDAFFKELGSEIERMHEDLKIYHRDLHEGNVMINFSEGCRPTVIDFGDAKKEIFSNENPYHPDADARGHSRFYTDDNQNVITVKRLLTVYFNEHGRSLKSLKETL